eukprot:s3018_g2.t1
MKKWQVEKAELLPVRETYDIAPSAKAAAYLGRAVALGAEGQYRPWGTVDAAVHSTAFAAERPDVDATVIVTARRLGHLQTAVAKCRLRGASVAVLVQ